MSLKVILVARPCASAESSVGEQAPAPFQVGSDTPKATRGSGVGTEARTGWRDQYCQPSILEMADQGEPLPTSAVLTAVSKHVAIRCSKVNKAFMACKNEHSNPADCLAQGDEVTSCVVDL